MAMAMMATTTTTARVASKPVARSCRRSANCYSPASTANRASARTERRLGVATKAARTGRNVVCIMGEDGDGQPKLTRDKEPEEAWLSKAEKEGKSPFEDPLAIAFIVGVTLPLVIVFFALATGVVSPPPR